MLRFARELAGRGIRLVIMPAPAKATVYPEMLSPGTSALAPLRNPSFAGFVAEMQAAGVLVFDPAPVLLEAKAGAIEPLYLATDTHWRPRAVELVAAHLAAFLREAVELDEVEDPGYLLEDAEVSHHGDLAVMLRLPAEQQVFPPERVTVRQVVTARRPAVAARPRTPTCCCSATPSPTSTRWRAWGGARAPVWRSTCRTSSAGRSTR